jgi:cytochrome c5
MNTSAFKTRLAIGITMFCLAASYSAAGQAQTRASPKEVIQSTGTTGATAFQPGGAARGEAEAGTGAQNGNAGMQQQAKPGFDNKPPKGAKASCHRPQGGVDASGGENIGSSSKENTTCTGKTDKKAKRR